MNNCKFKTDSAEGKAKTPFFRFRFAFAGAGLCSDFLPKPCGRQCGDLSHTRLGRLGFNEALTSGLVLVGLLLCPSVHATNQTHQLNHAIDQQKTELIQTRAAQDQLRKTLLATQQKLSETERAQNDIEDQISGIETDTEALETQKIALANQISRLKPQIADSLRLAYTLGDQASLGSLLAHTDALATERNLHYIKSLLSAALDKLLQLKKARLNQITNQHALQTTHNQLVAAQQTLDHTLAERQAQQAEQNRILTTLSAQLDRQSQHLATLLAQKRELDSQIARINAAAKVAREQEARDQALKQEARKNTHETPHHPANQEPRTPDEIATKDRQTSHTASGSLGDIPVQGRIIRAYGAPIAEGDMRAQGILYAAPRTAPIRAVAAGKVVFADSMKGWGNLVIIRHAKGYLSLYAHASELKVHTGMRVERGTELGLCGQVEARETGLYFEVRRGNDTINPLRWSPYRAVHAKS